MRVDANVSVHQPGDAVRHPLRDQEPQLGALARPGHRVRGAAPDRPDRGRRDGAPGDPALGRGRRPHAHAAHQGGRRRLPLLPRARPRAARARRRSGSSRSAPRCRCCRPRAATRARRGHRRRRRRRGGRRSSSTAARTTTCSPSATPAATRRGRSSTSRRRSPSRAPTPAVPAADLAALTHAGGRRRAHGDAGQAGARRARRRRRRRPGGDRRGQGLRGDGRRRRSRRWSTRRSPPTPAAWDKFVGGEDKAIGALVGAVMKASKGQADGKAVTALLRSRAGR